MCILAPLKWGLVLCFWQMADENKKSSVWNVRHIVWIQNQNFIIGNRDIPVYINDQHKSTIDLTLLLCALFNPELWKGYTKKLRRSLT